MIHQMHINVDNLDTRIFTMKTFTTSIAILLLAGSVNAASSDYEIYGGLAVGNPDLLTNEEYVGTFQGVVQSPYSDNDVYHGWENGNADLSAIEFAGTFPVVPQTIVSDNDIYHGFEIDNPDLLTDFGTTIESKDVDLITLRQTSAGK